ncbi:MAG: LysM peptidoglycan-binding domain-containing protein [Verrucomicrobia bacterium]|nr:LysM peptidoglycan-binding domain-containing protein [Verrucomicrobiota bacterium]
MVSPTRFTRVLLAALCSAVLCGCFPPGAGRQEEEKEPHFLRGRARVNSMDYQGAIESFGKALEVNPHSASAHLELGWLYAEKAADPAAAIYHYERYLKLRKSAENAETIRQHIYRLKQELAKGVLPMPSTPGIQRELEQLAAENRQLREEVEKWRTHYGGRGVTNTTASPGSGPQTTTTATAPPQGDVLSVASPVRVETGRTHLVRSGETFYSISQKYGVKLDSLMAANPGLNPKRMQVGQRLTIPAK